MKEIMIKLNPKFQKDIFQIITSKYKGSIKASKFLNIPAVSIRGYKNLYFNSVPRKLINKIIQLRIINNKELQKNILSVYNKEELITKNLNLGREKRKQNLKQLKKEIPKIHEIIGGDKISILKWFLKYKELLNSGFRKIKFKIEKDFIRINYSNFNRTSYKKFEVTIPREILLDEDFSYFFDL